jgi:cob(I)alamin adenosyltransferase
MSIATKRGDAGLTTLMFNRPISKSHPRVEAYGCVDELTSALGLARASATDPVLRSNLERIQRDLIPLMGELATAESDLARFDQDGFVRVTPEFTGRLDRLVQEVESQLDPLGGWAIPGGSLAAAALDLARTVCRRAERRVCTLRESEGLANVEIIAYLNRLGDLLWLFARWIEQRASPRPPE